MTNLGWIIFCFIDDLRLYERDKKEIDTLVKTTKLLTNDTGMHFVTTKYSKLFCTQERKTIAM